ncbi:hypothetical protein H839_17548 [Parageobacillus genomosp. 1]|uniref:Sporulation protein n=1 Tax=Parageobacillus genomosp. 1 TaxID=1295642 RepID=A0ABC9VB66_9BACL|nr:hypothetical protein [Parageobacillus genomosp. 1]EZP75328.1 hypothetical protein H839_17548 [Parageobacillus genomosp. 1]
MRSTLLLGFVLLLSACSLNPDHPSYHQQSEDRNGTRLITDDKAQSDYDRYLYNNFDDPEKTRQNPNFISITEGSENNRADVRKAAQVIETYTDYEPGSIWMNGNDMYVTVHVPSTMPEEKRQKEQRRIHKLLTKAIPTYDIHVRLD